jgi:hypothetical protein
MTESNFGLRYFGIAFSRPSGRANGICARFLSRGAQQPLAEAQRCGLVGEYASYQEAMAAVKDRLKEMCR